MAGGFDTLENYLGIRSTNIQNTNIPGMEISIVEQGDIGEISITTLAGYTYINPTAINPDSAYLATFSDPELRTLKYRNKHMARMIYKLIIKIRCGTSVRYTSLWTMLMKCLQASSRDYYRCQY